MSHMCSTLQTLDVVRKARLAANSELCAQSFAQLPTDACMLFAKVYAYTALITDRRFYMRHH